jgi:hypothetical protein
MVWGFVDQTLLRASNAWGGVSEFGFRLLRELLSEFDRQDRGFLAGDCGFRLPALAGGEEQ